MGCDGGIDGSAAIKAIIVNLVSLLFLAEYCALVRGCDQDALRNLNSSWNFTADCKVPAMIVGMSVTDVNSTWAMYYAVFYAVMAVVSFIGCMMIMCQRDGWAKAYAFVLIVLFAGISVGDYWVIGAIWSKAGSTNQNLDMRNYAGFKVAATWFLQLFMYMNAAWDAFDTSDEKKVDVSTLTR